MSSDVPRLLSKALKEHPRAELFVMSEYTFDGPVPESTFQWCRTHQKYLIVGGKDMLGGGKYYNTAFVISPAGDVVFKQVKSVPIQFFKDGLPAPELKLWNSPWGRVGICICYDFGYTHVVDRLVRMGAQLLVVPTMDAEEWGAYEHKLHLRVVSARAQEHGLPVVRLASSGISQIYSGGNHPHLITQTTFPGSEETMGGRLSIPEKGTMPWDRILARICVALTGIVAAVLAFRNRGQLKFRVV
jgi:predicted amidohydrolase